MLWPELADFHSQVLGLPHGESVIFEFFIWIGYIFGIIRKFMLLNAATGAMDWLFYLSWAFYFLNFTEITIDMLLYHRNVKLDRERDAVK